MTMTAKIIMVHYQTISLEAEVYCLCFLHYLNYVSVSHIKHSYFQV